MKEKMICTQCRKPAKELYIVRVGEAICVSCLTEIEEDVARYPKFKGERDDQNKINIQELAEGGAGG